MAVSVHKLVTAAEAVARFVTPGAVVGMGGQNINRCPMALVHEVVRQAPSDLTVVGCNLSLPLDLLVAAGLVVHTEQGSGNLERYGVLFSWRRALERDELTTTDHSHLAMASRFLAGALGVPFLPTRSLLGSTLLDELITAGVARRGTDPFGGDPVVLVRALRPDVSLIHVSRADPDGNAVIDGPTSHEVDMVRASDTVIVSAEQVVPPGTFADAPEQVTISAAYVTAVVEQPYGAYPTSVYRAYDYSDDDVAEYQRLARAGRAVDWLARHVTGTVDFDAFLQLRDPSGSVREGLREQMGRLI